MGYGTFGMAEAMAPGGKVTGIDIEPYFCDFVNKTARQRNLNIEVKQGLVSFFPFCIASAEGNIFP